ncbi:hypothetical protein WA026_000233 [Henosepilachna vigintioctopunctata]|uniref:Glycosyltransferase family 92 protein n=1 Tax=Henosepilachna vigintioctopunctata TaxID=420089 RepID=A0AAW1UYL6_9CUCU
MTKEGTFYNILDVRGIAVSISLHLYNQLEDAGVSTDDIYCQIQSKNHTYHFTKAVITPIWSKGWNQSDSNVYFEPVLVTCRIKNNITPKFISLNTKSCKNPKNYFKIERNRKDKVNFTVCVKPLSFKTDISKELIQWIIMNELLGANKIVLYYHMVKNKTRNLLEWLQASYKTVEVKYFKPVTDNSNYFDEVNDIDVKTIWQKRKYEVTAYNDCFYHNLNSNYVIPLDIDEVIVPKRDNNWKDLFRSLSGTLKGHFASFSVRNTYYFRELDNKTEGEPVFFFKHVSRSKLSDKEESGKSFISSTNSLTVFNHYALHTLRPGISRTYFFSSRRVQLNHYRRNCSIVILPECDKYISSQRFFDPVIFKYKDEFYSRYRNLSEQLELLKVFG